MEGLEIQEFNLASILKHENIRLEAEFYTSQTELFSEYFLGKDIIKSCTYNSIYGMNAEGKGYPAIRMNEFDGLFTGKPTQFAHNFLLEDFKKHQLKENDILICRTNGNPNLVGKSALVMIDEPYVYESHLFKIQPKQEIINSHTLATYLNCKYGKQEIFRYSMQGNQSNFSLAKFKEMKIPKFSSALQKDIKILISSSFEKLQKSKEAYQAAQDLLLDHLGLKDFNLPAQAVNIKSFADSFGTSGRLDAEFYQEKYEKLIDKIKSYPKGYNTLDYFIKDFSTGFAYKSETYTETGIPLIRINNIGNGTLDISNAMLIPQGDISLSPKDVANENDILISMSGTIGNSCKVPKGVNAVVNQRIMRISPQNINVEVLPLIINSIIGKYQLERMGTGGVQTNISANDIKQIVIPNVEEKIQTQIADLIRQSNYLRIKSKGLLEKAKKAVELAIEKDQESALDFIKGKQTNDCNVH